MTDKVVGWVLDDMMTVAIRAVIAVFCLYAIVILLVLILRLVNLYRKYKQKLVILELTPPVFSDKTPLATNQLFSVLHGLLKTRSLGQLFLRYTPSFSMELTSSRSSGIRCLIYANADYEEIIRQTVTAYNPDVKVRCVKADDKSIKGFVSFGRYRQTGHFAMPIDTSTSINDHDPVSYLANSMTKLKDDEKVTLQLVITPAIVAQAAGIDRKIRMGYWSGSSLEKWNSTKGLVKILFIIIKLPFVLVFGMIYAFITNDIYRSERNPTYNHPSAKPPAEQELLDQMHSKLNQDLFYVSIRSAVIAETKKSCKERNKSVANSLMTFANSSRQTLRQTGGWLPWLGQRARRVAFTKRLPTYFHSSSNILSASELAAIYHFPHSKSGRAENVVKSLSRTLPAPISLKDNSKKLDIILGKNVHNGSSTPIGLTEAERQRHVYIIGGTGNGKTTMLQYGIVQDIKAGYGLAVIDPHGDMAQTILKHIPEDRIEDVIYFNPDDIDYPIAMNLLEIPDNLKGSALEREKDRITESVISVLRKIFSTDDSGGHRIEYVLRNAIQTALTTENPTIFTIFELLTNDYYRKKITNALPAGTLKNFWQNELGKAGAMQRVKMSQGVTSKIGRFEFSPSTKRVMGRAKSTINFDAILAKNKILICNFSKGNLGEDTSELFGTAVLAKLQLAALRRSRMSQDDRLPFHLYVDEFQNFATMPFVQMLSEARKYKLYLTMAEQSTAQQDEQRLVQVILANVGTVISFRTGSPVDEQLILPLFKPFINEGEIANLPSYNFYARLSAIRSQEPLSGETLLLEDDGDDKVADRVIKSSRKLYSYDFNDINKEVEKKKQATTLPKEQPLEDDPLEV